MSTPAPCGGTDRSPTNDRELSDAGLATLWPRLDPALKLILLTGQQSGEVVAMEKEHVAEGLMPLPSLRRRPRFMPETRDALFVLAASAGFFIAMYPR